MEDKEAYRRVLALATHSKCLRRQVGCIVVVDCCIVGTGYNRVPRGIEPCEVCNRVLLPSGESLDQCPALHGEVIAIGNAYSRGRDLSGGTLYTSNIIPCKSCLGLILEVGIIEIVVVSLNFYDQLSQKMLSALDIETLNIREFNI